MQPKYEPKFGRVLIRREVNEKTAGGIIIANAKRHATCEGIILALGETAGLTEIPGKEPVQTLKIGDKVIFGRHSGTWLDETYSRDAGNDDGTLFMCQDQDILAVIKE